MFISAYASYKKELTLHPHLEQGRFYVKYLMIMRYYT